MTENSENTRFEPIIFLTEEESEPEGAAKVSEHWVEAAPEGLVMAQEVVAVPVEQESDVECESVV